MSAAEDQIREMLATAIDPREFDQPEFQKDPFPLYQRLRDHHPCYHDRFHNRWVISRYWDVDAVFQATEAYTRGIYDEEGPYEFGKKHVFGPNILEYGRGDHHRWLRNVIAGQFVGQKLNDFLPYIDMIAQELIDKFKEKGEVELADVLKCIRVMRLICALQGVVRGHLYGLYSRCRLNTGACRPKTPFCAPAASRYTFLALLERHSKRTV